MALRRPVLAWAVSGGVAAGLLAVAFGMRVVPALMLGWCLLATIYMALMLLHLWAADADTMRRRAQSPGTAPC